MTDPARPIRQEKQRATQDIVEVAPGVLRSQLPIDLPGLGHVNCYLLEDDRGVALVDPGLPGDASWAALEDRLKRAGYGVGNVHTVICTHSHHDHFGGAERLREASGAEIITHESFGSRWEQIEDPEFAQLDGEATDEAAAQERSSRRPRRPMVTPWGTVRSAPPPEVAALVADTKDEWFQIPKPSQKVTDGQVIRLARREWVAVHTPGHTADHLCLFDPEHGVMLSGDHVLPTITPHIGAMYQDADPLQQFFSSLDRMIEFDSARLVLPAHGHPFENLAERSREIQLHHHGRLQQLLDAAESGERATVTDYMRILFRERSWGDMAESETYAHLDHLRLRGAMETGEENGMMTFALSSRNGPGNSPKT